MRKIICLGVALGALAGTGVFVAARHAAKHPDSFLARCVSFAGLVGSRCNPLGQTTTVANRPVPCCEEEPAAEVREAARPLNATREVIEPILVEPVDPGLVPLRPETQKPESGSIAVVDARVPFMPYADEPVFSEPVGHEVGGCRGLSNSASRDLIEACWGSFASLLPNNDSSAPACTSDCFVRMSLQPFRDFVKALHHETANELQSQIQQVEFSSTPEQSDPVTPLPFQQLIIDPHHHHHYPSCPYTGRCPVPTPSMPNLGPVQRQGSTPSSPVPPNEVSQAFLFWMGLFR